MAKEQGNTVEETTMTEINAMKDKESQLFSGYSDYARAICAPMHYQMDRERRVTLYLRIGMLVLLAALFFEIDMTLLWAIWR
jgi:hypothetical protein